MKGFLQVYRLYEKCSIHFASMIRSLGKHCFLPLLANRMIRMSKDEEIGKKKERKEYPTYNMIINCIGIGVDEEEGLN